MTPDRQDLLVRELSHELADRASDVAGRADLAGAVIARADAVRRRRTASACLSAVAVTAAVILTATTLLPLTGSPVRGSAPAQGDATTSSVPTLAQIPYALDNREIHLNGHTTHLPSTWTLREMIQAGPGLVLDVAGPNNSRLVAYVSPDGGVRRLPDIAPPVAVNPAGTLVAGSQVEAPSGSTGYHLIEESLPGGVPVQALSRTGPGVPVLSAHNFAANGDVLLDSLPMTAVWRWHPGARSVVRAVALSGNRSLLGAAPGGGYFVLSGTNLVRTTATGATRWQLVDRNGGQRPVLSPDGSQLVLTTQPPYRVSVVDASTGTAGPTLATVPLGAAYDGLRPPVWFDDSTVLLAVVPADQRRGDQLFSCSLTARTCTHLLTAPGRLLVADRTWLSPAD